MPSAVDEWIVETPESLAARLDAAKEAQQQIRFMLGLMAITSIGTLFLSAVDDVAVMGTVALLVAALWLLLDSRREHHTVQMLLRDIAPSRHDEEPACLTDDAAPFRTRLSCSHGQRWLIFHTISASNFVVAADHSIGWAIARDFFFHFPVCASLLAFSRAQSSYESIGPFLTCWIPLLACCHAASRCSKATGEIVREYGERLRADFRRRQPRTSVDGGRRRAHAIVETTSKLRLNPH